MNKTFPAQPTKPYQLPPLLEQGVQLVDGGVLAGTVHARVLPCVLHLHPADDQRALGLQRQALILLHGRQGGVRAPDMLPHSLLGQLVLVRARADGDDERG